MKLAKPMGTKAVILLTHSLPGGAGCEGWAAEFLQDPRELWGGQGAFPHTPRGTLGSISAASLCPPSQKLAGKMKPW